jgi:sorting nexin-8
MSLFGDDDLPARPKQSTLFDDGPNATSSSLFTDDLDHTSSPWGLPTSKKAARGTLVKTLLAGANIPDSYIDAYDALIATGETSGTGLVSVEGVKRVLGNSGLGKEEEGRILEIVLQHGGKDGEGLGRGEFNVLMALVGLAQKGEDVTLDSVDDHRRSKCDGACFVFT